MSTILQLRTSSHELWLQWPHLSEILRVTIRRMIAARQAKADRIVKEQLVRLGLQHPRDRRLDTITGVGTKREAS